MFSFIFSNNDVKIDFTDAVISVLIFIFGLYFFTLIYSIQVDMSYHIIFTSKQIFDENDLFALRYDWLLRIMTYILSLFSKKNLVVAYPGIISFCLMLKYLFLRVASMDYLSRKNLLKHANGFSFRLGLIFLCFIAPLLLFTQLVNNEWQIDVLRVNPWHNPTTICVTPFALLLFYFSYLSLITKTIKIFIIILFLFLINLFIKPSFLIVWLPIYYLMLNFVFVDAETNELKFKVNLKYLLTSLLIMLIPLAGLFLLKSVTVKSNFSISLPYSVESHLLRLNFDRLVNVFIEKVTRVGTSYNNNGFNFWLYLLLYKPATIILGLAFPISVMFINKIKREPLLIFSWLCISLAIIIDLLFSETTGHRTHLNFSWQVPVCVFILFFSSFVTFAYKYYTDKVSTKLSFLITGLFLLHVYSGFIFIQRIIFTWRIL